LLHDDKSEKRRKKKHWMDAKNVLRVCEQKEVFGKGVHLGKHLLHF
jgi:hypothetical protein